MIRLVLVSLFLISCESHSEDLLETNLETDLEVDCESIYDPLECMGTEGCNIFIECYGVQYCDQIVDKETCELFFCYYVDGKCISEGDGTCSNDFCPILKGCLLRGKCVKEVIAKKNQNELLENIE